jgi:hypothetical protein
MYYSFKMNRNYNLVGPIEPSGLSWLVNCLLELNIRTSQSPEIWDFENGKFKVKEVRQELSRWLPALGKIDREFEFIPGLSVTWSHDWPTSKHISTKTLLFTRDPRMALYSGYKRNAEPGTTFRQYLLKIDPKWLLNRMQLWSLFHLLWSSHPQVQYFFFEDYKRDPGKLLSRILVELGIEDCSENDILGAVASSSWEKARKAEAVFNSNAHSDKKIMIRKGSLVLENAEREKSSYEMIENVCAPVYQILTGKMNFQQYIDQSVLWPYYVDYMGSHLTSIRSIVVPGLITHRHINSESISAEMDGSQKVIGPLIRKITKDYFGDLNFLISQKIPSYTSRTPHAFAKLLSWTLQTFLRKIRSKIRTKFSRSP